LGRVPVPALPPTTAPLSRKCMCCCDGQTKVAPSSSVYTVEKVRSLSSRTSRLIGLVAIDLCQASPPDDRRNICPVLQVLDVVWRDKNEGELQLVSIY